MSLTKIAKENMKMLKSISETSRGRSGSKRYGTKVAKSRSRSKSKPRSRSVSKRRSGSKSRSGSKTRSRSVSKRRSTSRSRSKSRSGSKRSAGSYSTRTLKKMITLNRRSYKKNMAKYNKAIKAAQKASTPAAAKAALKRVRSARKALISGMKRRHVLYNALVRRGNLSGQPAQYRKYSNSRTGKYLAKKKR